MYDRVELPFVDRAIDFVICSHVLEHVHPSELAAFLSELSRVGTAGYLEFPRYTLEMQGDVGVHRWLLNVVNGEIRLLPKELLGEPVRIAGITLGRLLSELTERSPGYQTVYRRYLPLWICGLRWNGNIPWRVVNRLDDLLDPIAEGDLVRSLAEREVQESSIVRRLQRRLSGNRGGGDDAIPLRRGLPAWATEVLRCVACGASSCSVRPDAVECRACGASYPRRQGEILMTAGDPAARAPDLFTA